MREITLCSGFPASWPPAFKDRFQEAFRTHWPVSIALELIDSPDPLDTIRASAPAAAAAGLADGAILAWLDPDVETMAAVPDYVIPHLLKDADLCFIGTAADEADLAFWAVRLSPQTRDFLQGLAGGSGTPLERWAAARAAAQLAERDLTPGGSGVVWAFGPLGRYTQRIARPE